MLPFYLQKFIFLAGELSRFHRHCLLGRGLVRLQIVLFVAQVLAES
jgi:hypothetical protein